MLDYLKWIANLNKRAGNLWLNGNKFDTLTNVISVCLFVSDEDPFVQGWFAQFDSVKNIPRGFDRGEYLFKDNSLYLVLTKMEEFLKIEENSIKISKVDLDEHRDQIIEATGYAD